MSNLKDRWEFRGAISDILFDADQVMAGHMNIKADDEQYESFDTIWLSDLIVNLKQALNDLDKD